MSASREEKQMGLERSTSAMYMRLQNVHVQVSHFEHGPPASQSLLGICAAGDSPGRA
jgi:hypothetical protein